MNPYWRLIQKSNKALTAAEENIEEEKIQKFLVKCKDETEESRQKRQAKETEASENDWAFLRDVVYACDFRIAGGSGGWASSMGDRRDPT